MFFFREFNIILSYSRYSILYEKENLEVLIVRESKSCQIDSGGVELVDISAKSKYKADAKFVARIFKANQSVESYISLIVENIDLSGPSEEKIKENFADFIEEVAAISEDVRKVFATFITDENQNKVQEALFDSLFTHIAGFHLMDAYQRPSIFKFYREKKLLEDKQTFIRSLCTIILDKIADVVVDDERSAKQSSVLK